MKRLDPQVGYNWHAAINKFASPKIGTDEWPTFMYLAKQLADEVARMAMLFEQEHTNTLPAYHQQYIHSAPEPLPENHLTCALGVKCAECPYLKALEGKLQGKELYQAKAWTCGVHLITQENQIDLSEGFVKTKSDHIFWQRLYDSLGSIDFTDDEDEEVD